MLEAHLSNASLFIQWLSLVKKGSIIFVFASTYLKDIFPSSTKLDQGLSTKAGSSILKKKSMLSGEGSSLKKKVGIQSKKIIIHESDDESEVKE